MSPFPPAPPIPPWFEPDDDDEMMITKFPDICLRCGQCCHYIEGYLGKVVPCRFLYKLKDGRTGCSVYSMRKSFNPVPGRDAYCLDRKDSAFDFPGCPYNTGKPMFPLPI